jgi:hypothetical protein
MCWLVYKKQYQVGRNQSLPNFKFSKIALKFIDEVEEWYKLTCRMCVSIDRTIITNKAECGTKTKRSESLMTFEMPKVNRETDVSKKIV